MSSRPSKQAALSGVEFVNVAWLTLAPDARRHLTTSKWPAPAAHHNADAPENKEVIIIFKNN